MKALSVLSWLLAAMACALLVGLVSGCDDADTRKLNPEIPNYIHHKL